MPFHGHPVAAGALPGPLSAIPLDNELIARLKSTYARVRSNDLRLASTFYAKLFEAAPQLRTLFRDDLAAQARKLTAALDLVVNNFDRPADNAAMIAGLGRRHAAYGARAEHYDLVVDLLIESMREVLGPSADAKALGEWRMVLRLVSNQMIAAAQAS